MDLPLTLWAFEMAVGQNQWDPILGWVNSPPILVYSGDGQIRFGF